MGKEFQIMEKNKMKKIPLIDITDLYHPYQDPSDNFDLIMPYALDEIDLKAIILDCTDKYRQPVAEHKIPEFTDKEGPRDPGIIPVIQLNYLFGKNVLFGVSPFSQMKTPEDKMYNIPAFQQHGIDLIHKVLTNSKKRVQIVTFSSLRALAAAYNRKPDLFYEKVERIHISAGASSPNFLEWNVELDPNAFVCLLRSNLPIAIYPCATEKGPFDLGNFNTYWKFDNLSFIKGMDPKLKRYLWYAFERVKRVDFLRAMDEDIPEKSMERIYGRPHNVWETPVWLAVCGRKLVKREDKIYRIVKENDVKHTDIILHNELLPCRIDINDKGLFCFELTREASNFAIYYRDDPKENERAFREALAELYQSIRL